MEKQFEELIQRQAAAEKDLADPDIYADAAKSSELLAIFEDCRKKSETVMEEMAELEAEIAAQKQSLENV